MASDTVPAATGTPDPASPHPADGPPAASPKNWLAAALAPVEPARPTFDLTPATGPADGQTGLGSDTPASGASSAAYHDGDPQSADGSTKKEGGSQERSVVRAWLLAGAERWRKGADARNKLLDIRKAKATALQVKEARTVNRSEKIVGGSTNTGNDSRNTAEKSLDNKTSKKDSGGKGPGGGQKGAGGRSGGSGNAGSVGGPRNGSGGAGGGPRSGSGSGGGRGGTNNAGTGSGSGGGKGGGKADPHKPKSEGGGGGQKSSGGGGGKPGKDGPSGKQGPTAPVKASKDPKPGTDNRSVGKDTKTQTATCGDASGISLSKDKKTPSKNTDTAPGKPSGPADNQKTPHAKGAGGAGGPAGAAGPNTSPGKTPAPTPAGGGKPVDLGKKNPDGKGGDKTNRKTTPATDPKTAPKPKTVPASSAPHPGGPTVNTQATREAGYRDGTRAAKAAAHIKAYRDGTVDGWKATGQAAARDKERLDKAHAQRKQHTPQPAPTPSMQKIPPKPKEPPVPAASSADYQPPQPVQVTSVTPTHLNLGHGADRPSVSRGEVRTLKQYQRVMSTKADRMSRIADGTKSLQAHAEEQAKKVTQLLEQAKAVEGGENLTAALVKLEEAATSQARKAGEIHKRAVRAADSCTVLIANVETRYGGMYQAVVDSDANAPAKMPFYADGGSNA